eukprot:1667463-Amphidinium_carterae.2
MLQQTSANMRSMLLGAYTRQGSGVSKYTQQKQHLLDSLHIVQLVQSMLLAVSLGLTILESAKGDVIGQSDHSECDQNDNQTYHMAHDEESEKEKGLIKFS